MTDMIALRWESKQQLTKICAVLAESGDVNAYHMERLTQDRDAAIYHAVYDLQVPAIEVAEFTGLPWTDVYDIADRLYAEMLDRVHNLLRPKQ